jgi:hypothetical protein
MPIPLPAAHPSAILAQCVKRTSITPEDHSLAVGVHKNRKNQPIRF